MKMLDLKWSTTIHLVMNLAGFFRGQTRGITLSILIQYVLEWYSFEGIDLEMFKLFLLLYADDIVIVPETEEAWNMAYFCLKIIVSGGNLL